MDGLDVPYSSPDVCTRSVFKDPLGGHRRGCPPRGEGNRGWEAGGAPSGSNRWFCNVSRPPWPQRRAVGTGCRTRPQPPPPPPPPRVPSASRGSRRVAATVAGGAAGGVAGTGSHAPRRLARDPRARRGGETGPRAARGASARLADTCLPRLASPRRRLSVTAPGLGPARAGYGGAARLRERRTRSRGEMLLAPPCGPPDWPGRPGRAGGSASLSCTAPAAPGSNSSHLLIRES